MVALRFVPQVDTEVYSLDGHLLGTVKEAYAADYASSRTLARRIGESGRGYFILTGFKGSDLYVPFDAMSDYAEERVRLRFTRKQVAAQGWDRPPTTDARSERM